MSDYVGIYSKIELFNKLKTELQSEFGCFDTIGIVDEYGTDTYESDGIHYADNSSCEESVPITVLVKRI